MLNWIHPQYDNKNQIENIISSMFRKDNAISMKTFALKLITVTGTMEFNTKLINIECIQHLWWFKSEGDKTDIRWLLV